jgi:DNA-binding FadR family transcriptional regulator
VLERSLRLAVTTKTAPIREPVPRAHVADAIFERLAGMILTGELAPGNPLPPERDLAERFDVSRIIVRSATHRLAELGLCRVRQGGATLVCDPAESSHPDVALLAMRFSPSRKALLIDLFERQLLGAHPLLVLAEPRMRAEHVATLRALVDRHDSGALALRDFEEAFWIAVADIGGNSVYRRETRFWFRAVREQPGAHHPEFGTREQRIGLYREIIRRLEHKQDAAEAYLRATSAVLSMLAQRER